MSARSAAGLDDDVVGGAGVGDRGRRGGGASGPGSTRLQARHVSTSPSGAEAKSQLPRRAQSKLLNPDRSAGKWAETQRPRHGLGLALTSGSGGRVQNPDPALLGRGVLRRHEEARRSGPRALEGSGARAAGAVEDDGGLEEEWAEASESVARLEARVREFVRQLDTGRLQNRAARKLTNEAGEEVVRCRCTGSFGRQVMLVPVGASLEGLRLQISEEITGLGSSPGVVDPDVEVKYADTDGGTFDIRSDRSLRTAIADARARADETLTLQLVTRLDREREAAAAAAAAMEKEKAEADAAEAAARRELLEAEEAERHAEEARAHAMAAKASHSKEELEAEEAEQHAAHLHAARQAALAHEAAAADELRAAVARQQEAHGDAGAAAEAAAAVEAAGAALTEAKAAAATATAAHAAAVADAERERAEADAARMQLEAERCRADEMERLAAKERAEAEAAMVAAAKERAEYEAARSAQQRADDSLAKSLASLAALAGDDGSPGDGRAAADAAAEADAREEERARLEREAMRAGEQEARRRALAAELLQCNVRVFCARKAVKLLGLRRALHARKAAATCIQRLVCLCC